MRYQRSTLNDLKRHPMRGADTCTEGLFTLKKLDDFVPTKHPFRVIRTMANKALAEMIKLFAQMYEDDIKGGRHSIAPEKLLRAMLLQVVYSIRSERQLMEQTQYNLLFRWLIGLSMDDSVWVPTVFTKNRERLIEHDAVAALFNEVLKQADKKKWLSKEHFSVDGALIQSWAGHKSFVRNALQIFSFMRSLGVNLLRAGKSRALTLPRKCKTAAYKFDALTLLIGKA
jgi:transposase